MAPRMPRATGVGPSGPSPSEAESTQGPRLVVTEVAAARAPPPPPPPPPTPTPWPAIGAAAAGAALLALGARRLYARGSRPYAGGAPGEGNGVGAEYDAWTEDGVLEYYWGEHIHLGHYSDAELAQPGGWRAKDFKQAKLDFIDEMLAWSGATAVLESAKDAASAPSPPLRILDVGCGIGGTTRRLASLFPGAEVVGITISPQQVARATALAAEQGIPNASFVLMDALSMTFDDSSFDVVWGCESGEHMPDKRAYVNEMTRVLKPGGALAIATWCQRDAPPVPGSLPGAPPAQEGGLNLEGFTPEEQNELRFLYEEWAHPYFVSYEDYQRMLEGTQAFEEGSVEACDWTRNTIASWRHSIWVGAVDPWVVVRKGPRVWYKVTREIVTLERMHRAFAKGLMTYGMIKGTKKVPVDEREKEKEKGEEEGVFGKEAMEATGNGATAVDVDALRWAGEEEAPAVAPAVAAVDVDSLRWAGEEEEEEKEEEEEAAAPGVTTVDVDALQWAGEVTAPPAPTPSPTPSLAPSVDVDSLRWAGEEEEEEEAPVLAPVSAVSAVDVDALRWAGE